MALNVTSKTDTCIECGNESLTSSKGFIVCRSCGITQEKEYVDYKASMSNEKENPTHQNFIGKTLDFVGGLGSQIGYNSGMIKDRRGKILNVNRSKQFMRLKKYHNDRARLQGNATHLRTMIAFNRVVSHLKISKDIKHRSLYLYWKHVNSDNRITNHVLLISLCLLQAIREAKERAPIRFAEVVKTFKKNGHRVTNKNILKLARELDVPLSANHRTPNDYIERIAAQVRNDTEIAQKVKRLGLNTNQYEMLLVYLANEFLSNISTKKRGGVQPFPFAISIVYLADRVIGRCLGKKPILTQNRLSRIMNSAEFTIRDHIYRFLGELYQHNEERLITCCKMRFNAIA